MRSPALVPMEFDREFRPHSQIRALLASRRTRYILGAVALLSFVTAFFAFSGPEPFLRSGSTYDVETDVPPPTPHDWPRPGSPPPKLSSETSGDPVWRERADRVKDAFVTAYTAYEKAAFPHDELLPISNGHSDHFNGWGATLVDSLDTMIMMDLHDLSNKTVGYIAQFTFDDDQYVQFFETVIRYLGGFLSAYALSGNPIFLTRADDLGRRLLPAFNTQSKLPAFAVNVQKGVPRNGWAGNVALLSEASSCQMEYRYLAHLTGRPEYIKTVDYVTDLMHQHEEEGGLYALMFNLNNGEPANMMYSVGAMADSAYEYLLKQWLMTGRTEPKFLDMYMKSANAIIEKLLYLSPSRQLLYVTDVHRGSLLPVGDFQHLSCFIGGLFALGAAMIPNVDPRHAWAAEGLAHTCWVTYADMPTGLGPEKMMFANHGTKWVDALDAWEKSGRPGAVPPGVNQTNPVKPGEDKEYRITDSRYILRPETIESFYILWRTTGESKWRDRGWAIFDAIEKHTKTKSAYGSIANVNQVPPPLSDDMPTFFLAETLKYAYLLFTDEDIVPLHKWTFNTEAHPFPTFEWSDWEKNYFEIS